MPSLKHQKLVQSCTLQRETMAAVTGQSGRAACSNDKAVSSTMTYRPNDHFTNNRYLFTELLWKSDVHFRITQPNQWDFLKADDICR